ncbi:LacI family DNA-binding transcriptional regulator [Nonomuraea pusilla]|uniref:Transcriptional regulator, LacI family n=1 Tax=Nonomuraea pusilla TaxID=46177 RepID=A0A1H8CDQ2_9ACTN|nr:LacI family DNA-binding transcriptional regulator [Nonomuraea pusilla]SEM93391.1 transcriptional regulator, LacI family [Nonomuraea pusilla]
MTSGRVTIADVARRAGVSTAAVSKVVRGAYGVSAEMQAKVTQAIDELGYRPHAAARALRGRTYTLGVMLSDTRNPFFPDIIEGVTGRLRDTEYQVLLGPGGIEPRTQARMTDAMIDRSMDGLILISPVMTDAELAAIAAAVPVVVVGRHGGAGASSAAYDSVVDDDVMGARLVVDHLVGLGHTRIAHITHLERARAQGLPHTVRAEGYRQAMRAHGLADDVLATSFTEEGGFEGARELLARDDRPTAIFAGADIAALGVLRAADEAGLSVPEDLSVAGYDNIGIASLKRISLTSVDQDGHVIGATAARLLVERIEGRSRSVASSVSPTLIVRGTTGPPRL